MMESNSKNVRDEKKRKTIGNCDDTQNSNGCSQPKKKKKKLEIFDETDYILSDGLRHVIPYIYQYKTNAKKRWFGRKLLEVFTKEFGAHPPEYYIAAVKSGRIKVNGKAVDEDYQIKNGDHIIHTTHRHEPPVNGQHIEIIANTDSYLVVNKPPSMPMHPCGAYRYNSLFYILNKEFPGGVADYHLCYRLDRLTSGLAILAKSTELKAKFSENLAQKSHKKTYLARVLGDFPSFAPERYKEDFASDKIDDKAKAKCWWRKESLESNGVETIRVNCPVHCANHKQGIWEVHEDGKEAVTLFKKLSFNGKTSLVEGTPLTGRTHQIRLHLQWLGHPIANDPNYGGELFYGELDRRQQYEESKKWMEEKGAIDANRSQQNSSIKSKKEDGSNNSSEVLPSVPQQEGESEEDFLKRTCRYCKHDKEKIFNENQLHATNIWLHALRYKGDDWAFEAPPPEWASESFQM